MNKKLVVIAGTGAAVLTLAGCGDNFRDLKNVPSKDPDSATVYNNVDGHPNIAELCIDGLGFATTTRQYDAAFRVPEWDAKCAAAKSAK